MYQFFVQPAFWLQTTREPFDCEKATLSKVSVPSYSVCLGADCCWSAPHWFVMGLFEHLKACSDLRKLHAFMQIDREFSISARFMGALNRPILLRITRPVWTGPLTRFFNISVHGSVRHLRGHVRLLWHFLSRPRLWRSRCSSARRNRKFSRKRCVRKAQTI